jgi:hypothetical protein
MLPSIHERRIYAKDRQMTYITVEIPSEHTRSVGLIYYLESLLPAMECPSKSSEWHISRLPCLWDVQEI